MNVLSFIKRGLALGVAALALTGVVSAQTSDTQPMTAAAKEAALKSLEEVLLRDAFVPGVSFTRWPEMVKKREAEFEKAKTRGQFADVVNTAMEEFGFSHIVLFPPSYGEQRVTQRRSGIGIRITLESKGIRVMDVFPDSPATDIGLQPGDLIIECDGKAARVVADLQGDKGQKSTIVFVRGTERLVKEVTRRDYKTVIPESLTWQGKTAVVRVPTFDMGYSRENVENLMSDVAEKADHVILDLRGNPGGRVLNLQHLASFFLDSRNEPMGTFIGKMQVLAYEQKHGPTTDLEAIAEASPFKTRASSNREKLLLKLPVAVLIDGGSGSASEILAAALGEIKSAPLVGTQTAGAVLASVVVPLAGEEGFWIQYPLTDYLTIKGRRLEGNGVEPTHPAKLRTFEKDEPLEVALKLLQKPTPPVKKAG